MLLQLDHESLSPLLHSHNELLEQIVHNASEEHTAPTAPTSCIRAHHTQPCAVQYSSPFAVPRQRNNGATSKW